jgi:hypothetical protein
MHHEIFLGVIIRIITVPAVIIRIITHYYALLRLLRIITHYYALLRKFTLDKYT